jgi:hypothetical protein
MCVLRLLWVHHICDQNLCKNKSEFTTIEGDYNPDKI